MCASPCCMSISSFTPYYLNHSLLNFLILSVLLSISPYVSYYPSLITYLLLSLILFPRPLIVLLSSLFWRHPLLLSNLCIVAKESPLDYICQCINAWYCAFCYFCSLRLSWTHFGCSGILPSANDLQDFLKGKKKKKLFKVLMYELRWLLRHWLCFSHLKLLWDSCPVQSIFFPNF